MFEKQIRIPEPEEIKQLVPMPESLKRSGWSARNS